LISGSPVIGPIKKHVFLAGWIGSMVISWSEQVLACHQGRRSDTQRNQSTAQSPKDR
jgi:hypothetical protein